LRFSLLCEACPFDLCQSCYEIANKYASRLNYSGKNPVVVHGKTVGDDCALSCAEVKQMQPVRMDANETSEDAEGMEFVHRQQLFDDFMDRLFQEVVMLLVEELKQNHKSGMKSLIQLTIAVVHHSGKGIFRLERAKRLGKELVQGLSLSLNTAFKEGDSGTFPYNVSVLLQSMAKLVVWDDQALACLDGSYNGTEEIADKTLLGDSPKCKVHGITAVCRRHRHDTCEGRRYFVCAKDSKSRCNFFLWEDDISSGKDQPQYFDEQVARSLWEYFLSPVEGHQSDTVLSKLCDFVTNQTLTLMLNPSNSSDCPFNESLESSFKSLIDGVFCSVHRLLDTSSKELTCCLSLKERACLLQNTPIPKNKSLFVMKTSFSLLALIGGPTFGTTVDWTPFLCEVILSLKDFAVVTQLAKRALVVLCAGKKGLYGSTRAHFTFGFHRDRLASIIGDVINEGLLVREKARLSGPCWKTTEQFKLNNLKAGTLIGTEDLVSEDIMTFHCLEEAHKILCELSNVAKKRTDHWRIFCGLEKVTQAKTLVPGFGIEEILKLPPAIFLFSTACLLNGDAQLKAFKLLDIALSLPRGTGKKQRLQPPGLLAKDDGIEEGKGGVTSVAASTPEAVLDLSVNNLFYFVIQFGCHGSSAELRSLACSITSKLTIQHNPSIMGQLFQRLICTTLRQTTAMGKCHSELLDLLQALAVRAKPATFNVAAAASLIQIYWKSQIQALKYGRSNHIYFNFETRSRGSTQKKRFELSPCLYCQQVQSTRKDKARTSAGSRGGSAASGQAADDNRAMSNAKPWHPEQVTVLSRGRLEGWRDSFASDEFNSYSSFKYRLVLAEVHFEVTDPRGRFVKTITIYFSPRPVSDVNQLKSRVFENKWQRCGTLTLSNGATRGSCKLDKPVVAANIRIEYTDFFERPGASKAAADGAFIVHCPRCA